MSDRRPNRPTERGKPEILAPAGGRAQLEAAVWAGADAVYFGLDAGLNARVRATSFAVDSLHETMDYLHERDVRGYLTLNTLVFDEELELAEDLIRRAAIAGVDALIVQDTGLLHLARATAPHLPIHASTQMSVTDADGVAWVADLGARRVVVGRELSIDEIAAIAAESRIEIEVFVHGAICVSYSGQCYSSEAWAGRSANRGQCAQSCRLPYDLVVDGRPRDLGKLHYLLSPQDLMGLQLLPRLLRAGVGSLKIEGRLKGVDYVLATVSAYREALDTIWAGLHCDSAVEHHPVATHQRRRLAQVFSRGQDATADGLSSGFLQGPRHQSLVIGRNTRHRGLLVGEVIEVTRRGVLTRLTGPVKRGDGLAFDHGRPDLPEVGGNLHHVFAGSGDSLVGEVDRGQVELAFGPELALARVHRGDQIWRSRDSAQDAAKRLDPNHCLRPCLVDITIDGSSATPLRLVLSDTLGHCVSVDTDMVLQPAEQRCLDAASIRKAIGRLGDTPLQLRNFECRIDAQAGPLFLPVGEIKKARRRALSALLAMRRQHSRHAEMPSAPVLSMIRAAPSSNTATAMAAASISVLCRTHEQVKAALDDPLIIEITVDFLEIHGLREACNEIRAAGRRLVVAAPRIFKPGEQRLRRYLIGLAPDALLLRSTGLLHALRGATDNAAAALPALHGDFSLNATNGLSAKLLLDAGLDRLTLGHDLNAAQILSLAAGLPEAYRSRLQTVIHQHLPIFHTEYCAFARFLSQGNSYRDCGRPCETQRLHLRSADGADHRLLADVGCRNTLFNAAAQSAGSWLNSLQRGGMQLFRIELVDEPGASVAQIVGAYRDLLTAACSPDELQRRLATIPDANGRCQGSGAGSLAVRVELPRERMKRPSAR